MKTAAFLPFKNARFTNHLENHTNHLEYRTSPTQTLVNVVIKSKLCDPTIPKLTYKNLKKYIYE